MEKNILDLHNQGVSNRRIAELLRPRTIYGIRWPWGTVPITGEAVAYVLWRLQKRIWKVRA